MQPKDELNTINKLLLQEEQLYNEKQKKLKKEQQDKQLKETYQDLLDDKVYGILGG